MKSLFRDILCPVGLVRALRGFHDSMECVLLELMGFEVFEEMLVFANGRLEYPGVGFVWCTVLGLSEVLG